MKEVEQKRGVKLNTYKELHQWSVDRHLDFWEDLFLLLPLIHNGKYRRVCDPDALMDTLPKWFEGVKINFAENILFNADKSDPSKHSVSGKDDAKIALTEVREGCKEEEIRHVTWAELRKRVGLLTNAMRAYGVGIGDRVAVVSSNSVDTLVVFLAVTSVGGIFSSSSTDMGTKGVLDRLLQIKPKFVFVDDWAVYNGKSLDLRPKIKEIEQGAKPIKELKGFVSMPRYQDRPVDVKDVPRTITLAKYLEHGKGDSSLRFERLNFGDPFLIVYSSGTTGVPKCIMHSIGGILISSLKEGRLNRDLGPTRTNLQYTTTGWIMYLTSVLGLQHGARAVLYDGSPFQPDLKSFVRMVGSQKVTDLGISPKYLQTLANAKPPVIPQKETDLSLLHRVTSTGMVLPEALFEWFYDQGFPAHVHLANITGGTDLAACFAMDNPLDPVYVGGCQGPGLGLKVEVYDQTIEGEHVQGRTVLDGEPGELVCTLPFPNQPPGFFADDTGEKYHAAYYARYSHVWTHGDFIYRHPKTGGIYILGRADGVLNPSGVRFGSAEIYNVIEAFFADEIADSLCVGRRRKTDSDEKVMLFLKMHEGKQFSSQLAQRVREAIAKQCSKRHVPAFVFQTWGIPTTVNLKKVELPVKRIVSGERIKPSGTLLNPESLDFYYRFATVEDDKQPPQQPVKSRL